MHDVDQAAIVRVLYEQGRRWQVTSTERVATDVRLACVGIESVERLLWVLEISGVVRRQSDGNVRVNVDVCRSALVQAQPSYCGK